MPEIIKTIINQLATPPIFMSLSILAFVAVLAFYRYLSEPRRALTLFAAISVIFSLSMFDLDFRKIVAKPDNIPIVGLLFLVGFFTWLGLRQAAINDKRLEEGKPPVEAKRSRHFLVWPDLVYIELLTVILVSAGLIVWSILSKAPLEEPSNPTLSPNPAKAPWYFLGLQEMLVYFDPWIAGVLLPSMIILGLMAIPYLDTNPRGSGYYTFKERKYAISVFFFGFLILWVLLIVLGTFLRGPNWNFFGPYETWDLLKIEPMVNVNLSEYIWVHLLRSRLPDNILMRELFGIMLLILYLFCLPAVIAKTWFKNIYKEMGFVRYSVMMGFLLVMFSLVIKMNLRWIFSMKYIVAIPEYFFNI